MLAKLGNFKFKVATASYDKFSRSSKYHWPSQDRFGQSPAVQFTGKGNDTISLSGTIYPEYKGGLDQINKMREMASLGEPLELYFSYDNIANAKGKWVIESVTEEQTYFHENGQPRKQAFTLELSSYG